MKVMFRRNELRLYKELTLLETPGGLRESTAYKIYASGQTPGGLDSKATRAWEPGLLEKMILS